MRSARAALRGVSLAPVRTHMVHTHVKIEFLTAYNLLGQLHNVDIPLLMQTHVGPASIKCY
eukprot:756085-Hanusia_phi.AAC.1